MHRHGNHQREDLTGEHTAGDRGQIIFACIFAAVWASDAFFLHYSTFPTRYMITAVKLPISIFLLVMAAYLAIRGLAIVFGEKRDPPAVIEKSVFGVVRHPVYLAEILLYLGLLIGNMSLAALGMWIGAIIFLHRIARYEENLLLARFGEKYRQYMARVPMWLPRISRGHG